VTQCVAVFLTIAGEQGIPAEMYLTERQLNGIALGILCFRDMYFAIHAPYHGNGEVSVTGSQTQLPYTTFNFIRIKGKIAGYKDPVDVLRIILALPSLQPLESMN